MDSNNEQRVFHLVRIPLHGCQFQFVYIPSTSIRHSNPERFFHCGQRIWLDIANIYLTLLFLSSPLLQFHSMMVPFSGQVLNFSCAFVVVLMLRRCITWLRMNGLVDILPLDSHVYLHKMCGAFIAFFATIHTVMHLINFRIHFL